MRPWRPRQGWELLFGLLLVAGFTYSALSALRQGWGGDVRLYLAGLAELDRDLLHPRHEAMPVSGAYSAAYTPFLVALAGLARLTDSGPVEILRFAAVLNLLLYALAVLVFFRVFSGAPRSLVPPVAFFVASALLRDRMFIWSSDTSIASLRFVAAYPSTFAWALALFALALTKQLLESETRLLLRAVSLAVLLAVLYLSHALTGSFVLVCLGALALATGRLERPQLALGLAVLGAFLLALSWPYYDVLGHRAYLSTPENAPFQGKELSSFLRAYVLAGWAWVLLGMPRRSFALIACWAASLGALFTLEALGVSYAARFGLFAAFFAFVLVAEGTSWALASLRLRPWAASSFLLALAVTLLTTPGIGAEARRGRPILGPLELLAAPIPADPIDPYALALADLLSPADVVMMPLDHLAFDLAALSGARVVLSPFASRVPDAAAREAAVQAFFDEATSVTTRQEILKRYGVSVVLVPRSAAVGPIGEPGPEIGPFRLFSVR